MNDAAHAGATVSHSTTPIRKYDTPANSLGNQDSAAVCAIGGTPATPVFRLEGETLPSGVAGIRDELLAGVHDGEF